MVTRILTLCVILVAASVGRAEDKTRERAKAALALAEATTLVVMTDVNGRTPKQAAKNALAVACGLPCDCGACPVGTCDVKMPPVVKPCSDCEPCICDKCGCAKPTTKPVFTKAESAFDKLFADVAAGKDRVVYVGYNPPKGKVDAITLDSFDGEKKGVFRCYLSRGKACYERRDDLIPMKDIVRTEQVKVCENGVCRFVDRLVTVTVPDEK